jgi:hypothetical protein
MLAVDSSPWRSLSVRRVQDPAQVEDLRSALRRPPTRTGTGA